MTAAVDNPLFARLWVVLAAHETAKIKALRMENLAGLSGRVLEIGAGAGTNFAYYPDTVTEVVAIEPEAHLLEHARAAAAAARIPVSVTEKTGEALANDPAGDEPFDAVVCSLVLCTVFEPGTVVRQAYSHLRPGGELRYLEHVASAGSRGRVQQVADATLWPRLFGNCHTHRDTESVITGAGFEVLAARHTWTMPRWAPVPVSEFAIGRAVRPS
ncbi:class I SAM-dependent methyltransferase [Mycolicibacterium brumae]|uniref:Class I SAM-dependent methyltransferase n=1 Tax=Mycolicibacterium brumae TaxID=85968 RepID=A0A2G5PFN3_9MYCO|nr:class I SAM-dependent methyltransferase [Mycolicibacterium brumae]MCV7192043.1 methyltransferase domain-containing protein [Mycolicibacterium brumae]PIB76754.1 class I SAM-dependent methyltransferase [Mycolicibacterium brumae]RWA20710.1 hypothetical protein MBRU_03360 [Mycolicibacterium brumae DSM 44177]UWW07808.1 class I SAM-dependent methyltransferase [Mycolicibacterium brumae]